ncbi:SusC/RagA family TonB-linked outer membrane protein [Larkinella bovis]|uniref:SusC/RagA family TonB-linked outer membrane protein n=1 Tax=Larkinella bovis TaxID=683041 RepID=A0ABW0IH44_9BACT
MKYRFTLRIKPLLFTVLLAFSILSAIAQDRKVRGKVISTFDQSAIPGVTVLVKNTQRGTVTDAQGNYEISVAPKQILTFSFVGYKTQEITVGSQTEINIELNEDATILNEVVAVGYGTIKKVNLTGAVDQLDGKQIQNMSVPNVSRALQGQIPGLNITFNSGRPNSNPSYNIRGVTSIGAGGSALILIDGAEGDPSTLNPQDIQSVSVLKDAASAAIYGSRGAFGVILITTKNPGTKSQLRYSATFSAQSRTAKRDVLQNSYLWSKMYMESFTELYGGTRNPTTVGDVGINFTQEYLNELKYRSENPNHGRPDVGIDPATGSYMYYGNTDWAKLIYKDNIPSMEHSLTASGGNEKASYYVSGRYFSQDGLYNIRSDKFRTYDLRMKGSVKPLNWLDISTNFQYSGNTYTDPFGGDGVFSNMYIRSGATPMGVPYNPDGSYTLIGSKTVGLLEGYSEAKSQQGQILANAAFDASIIKNKLKLQGNFTFRNRIIDANQKQIPVPYSNVPGVIVSVGNSTLSNNKNTLNYFNYNLYGNYTQQFGHHDLKILGGTNIEISKTRYLNVNRSNLIIPELDAFNLATGDAFAIAGGGSDWANLGIFSRVNYTYKDKYLVEINSRYDGSSKFPTNQQFGFFPSFSLGWRMTEENFLSGTRQWLDNLKPRVSYGSLGNSQINPYMFLPQITGSRTTKILEGARPVATRNPAVMADNFTWETSTTLDLGLDMDLLQNRLGVVFDWYKRTTSNMITAGPLLPDVFGAAIPQGNYADLETKGFELSVTWRDKIGAAKPFNYSVQFTLADDISQITKFNNPKGTLVIDPDMRTAGYYQGMKIGDIWGLTTLGLFASQEDINSHANQSFILPNIGGMPARPGDVKFKDLNGDGKIDWGDRTISNPGDLSIIGNMASRYKFGTRLSGEYGNFSLSAFFQGVGKRDWYPTHHQNPFWGPYGYWAAEIPTHFLENSYTIDNPDPNAYWPRWKGNMAYGNRQLQPQTRYLQNTAYIRLKEITLSYSPRAFAKKIGLSDLRVNFTGLNLWTYSPVFKITRDIDPEQMDGGIGTYYPMLKSYNLGINVTF